MTFQKRNCPNCEDTNSKVEVSLAIDLSELSKETLSSYFVGLRKEQVFFPYHRCNSCGLLYNPEYLTDRQLDACYLSMPDNRYGEVATAAERTQFGYVGLLDGTVDENAALNVLELGPDIGSLSAAIGRAFNVKRLELIEPNLDIHDKLAEVVAGSASQISISRYLDIKTPSGIFDLVLAVHVLDHLIDPKAALDQIWNRLRVGGYLLIVVHNEFSFLRRLLQRRWPPFCLQHPQLFNIATLRNFLETMDFRVIKHGRTVNWVSVHQLFNVALLIFGGANLTGRALWMRRLLFPIITGNQYVVACKRE